MCWYISDCDKEPAKEISTTVFTKNGHDYLIVDTKHGVCVIHAESCPCNKKKQRMKTKIIKYQIQISRFVVAIDKKELLPVVLQRKTKWILGKL